MLIVVNYYSQYPEVVLLPTMLTSVVIPEVEKMMATHGLFGEIRTDNRPPFNSCEWSNFLISRNSKHRRITPRWPQANGEAEGFVKTLSKTICIAIGELQNVESTLYTFLRKYRVTPHATTGVTPSQLCFGRVVTEAITHHTMWTAQAKPQNRSMERRSRNNDYDSQKQMARNTIREGDTLLVKDHHPRGKFWLPFKAELWTVTAVKGTIITAGRGGDSITRNVSQFKRFSFPSPPPLW
ncbi:hypothetical protein NDU88_002498 [Pleurodeles waltl]|uniref:Integrase catalytic domain-containing protein n=1 Tax=Pleurodeles waltl TaxID=8319 RepID=A0AAV7LE97_PLEWA|nr:hypothetical protein NDU88_002498 [Pleurodeles waltl]